MQLELPQIELIRSKFSGMQSKEDLVELLSIVKKIIFGEDCSPIHLKSLTYYSNPQFCHWRYTQFQISKKSGGERLINAPVISLKRILRSLNLILQCIYEPNSFATGFVSGRSIVDNATIHAGNHYVFNLDLEDFFHSFDRNRVKMGFMAEPFNLQGNREPLAFLLASLTTHPFEINGEEVIVLPQGSPTSPTITNILCSTLDRRLSGLAKRFGARYSRYADDITFSSNHNIYKDENFLDELYRIIEMDQQLKVNQSKIRLQKSVHRQEATGLIINEKANVRRRYIKQIRMWIYYWERYGYSKADQLFRQDYLSDKGHVHKKIPTLARVLEGKLNFLKMVRGEEDSTYNKLLTRFQNLSPELKTGRKERIELDRVIDVILNKGLDEGLELYSKYSNP